MSSAKHAPCYCCEPCREQAIRDAAPDLLAACKALLMFAPQSTHSGGVMILGAEEIAASARAAIAKAEGGTK